MSVYKTVQTQIEDMELLRQVLDELRLEYVYDKQGNLSYHKWKRPHQARGKDATIVIGRLNGGLDTTPRRFCGDTAFCVNEDGTVRVELDIAHGNAPRNWQRIQNTYALRNLERKLPRGYVIESADTDPISGEIEIKIKDLRRTQRDAGRVGRRVRA
jgi:hypothetical protein